MGFPHSDIPGSKVARHLPEAFRRHATSFIALISLGIHHPPLTARQEQLAMCAAVSVLVLPTIKLSKSSLEQQKTALAKAVRNAQNRRAFSRFASAEKILCSSSHTQYTGAHKECQPRKATSLLYGVKHPKNPPGKECLAGKKPCLISPILGTFALVLGGLPLPHPFLPGRKQWQRPRRPHSPSPGQRSQ